MLNKRRVDPFWKLIQPEFKQELNTIIETDELSHPLVVDLDPISSCNSACRYCVDAEHLNNKYFSKKNITRLLRELAAMGCRAIVIVGGGEPLTYPHFSYMLDLAVNLKFHIGLVTNGLRLPKYAPAIAKSCSWVRISVDAASSETYNFLHHPQEGGFEELLESIQSLAKIKQGSLGYSFIATRYNVGEISAAAELAAEKGCDFFELKTLVNPKNKGIIDLPDESQKQLYRQLNKLKQAKLPLELVLANSLDYLVRSGMNSLHANQCYAKKIRAVITPSGVYPCANLRGNKKWYLGDPQAEEFAFIWRRNNLCEIKPDETCRGYCARREFNLNLECLVDAKKKGASLINYLNASSAVGAGDEYLI